MTCTPHLFPGEIEMLWFQNVCCSPPRQHFTHRLTFLDRNDVELFVQFTGMLIEQNSALSQAESVHLAVGILGGQALKRISSASHQVIFLDCLTETTHVSWPPLTLDLTVGGWRERPIRILAYKYSHELKNTLSVEKPLEGSIKCLYDDFFISRQIFYFIMGSSHESISLFLILFSSE